MRDLRPASEARWPYGGMNYERARDEIRADLHACGFTPDDLDWLLKQGWDPVPYLTARMAPR